MTYKQMLDKLTELETKLSQLELDARYMRERITLLEQTKNTPKPKFASGTLPESLWVNAQDKIS